MYQIPSTNIAKNLNVIVVLDATTIVHSQAIVDTSTNANSPIYSSFIIKPLVAGTHTIEIKYIPNAGTQSIYNARLEFYKIN